jgi:hypothetical protein
MPELATRAAVLTQEQRESLRRWKSIHNLHYSIRRQESRRELEVAEFLDGGHHEHLTEGGEAIKNPVAWMARQLGVTKSHVYRLADYGRKVPALREAGWAGVGERKGRILRKIEDPADIAKVKERAEQIAEDEGKDYTTAKHIAEAAKEIRPPGRKSTPGWEPDVPAPVYTPKAVGSPLQHARDGLREVIVKLEAASKAEPDTLVADDYQAMADTLKNTHLPTLARWAAK